MRQSETMNLEEFAMYYAREELTFRQFMADGRYQEHQYESALESYNDDMQERFALYQTSPTDYMEGKL